MPITCKVGHLVTLLGQDGAEVVYMRVWVSGEGAGLVTHSSNSQKIIQKVMESFEKGVRSKKMGLRVMG